jgi:hypothetical protein
MHVDESGKNVQTASFGELVACVSFIERYNISTNAED